MATTIKTQATIQSAAIYRVTDKATHEKFYLVKSDSENVYHEVRWDGSRLAWTCNGDKCKFQHGGTNCKHARATNEVLKIRRAALAAQMGGDTPAIVARLQAREERRLANLVSGEDDLRFNAWHGSNLGAERPIEERGNLNGSREFSLLR